MSNEVTMNNLNIKTYANNTAIPKEGETKRNTPLLSFNTDNRSVVEIHNNDPSVKTEALSEKPSEPITRMKVKAGWGNQKIAIEVLKSYGIENPTAEQIKNVQTAIENANTDQVKVWMQDNNKNIPKGTKYFYANANINIPDLKELLGIPETQEVKEIKEIDEPITLTPIKREDDVAPQPPVKTPQNKPNDCVISNPTSQSKKTNDCWLLSGVNALMTTKWGREVINDSIKKDEHGNITITLKGADNKQIQVSPKELAQAKASGLYSEGDDNMIALEIAINKYKEEIQPRTNIGKEINGLAINWGEGYDLFHLLTGKNVSRSAGMEIGYNHPEYVQKGFNVDKALDTMRDNPDEVAMVVSFRSSGSPFEKFVVDGVELSPKHAYSVAGIEKGADGKEYVVIVNPRNSGERLKISRESFTNYLDKADAVSNSDNVFEPDKNNIADLIKLNLRGNNK